MESVKRCTVRFLDGSVAITEADRIYQKDGFILAYKQDEMVGLFNLSNTQAIYMTQNKQIKEGK